MEKIIFSQIVPKIVLDAMDGIQSALRYPRACFEAFMGAREAAYGTQFSIKIWRFLKKYGISLQNLYFEVIYTMVTVSKIRAA